MRLVLDDPKVTFTVTKAAEPKTEFGSGQQKLNRPSKLPEWVVEVLAMDSERGEVIRVTVTGDQPKVNQGQPVRSRSWRRSPGPTTAATGSRTAPPRFSPLRRPAPPEPGLTAPARPVATGDRPAIRSRPIASRTERITRCHDQQHHPDHGRQQRRHHHADRDRTSRARHGRAAGSREARELISLGLDALQRGQPAVGHDMHTVIYGDERHRQLPAAASPARRGADLPGDRRALPVHARQRLRGTRPYRNRPRAGRSPTSTTLVPGLEGAHPPARPATPNPIPKPIRERGEWRVSRYQSARRPVMCRPSCCNNSDGQGAGIAAVAVIIGAAARRGEDRPGRGQDRAPRRRGAHHRHADRCHGRGAASCSPG